MIEDSIKSLLLQKKSVPEITKKLKVSEWAVRKVKKALNEVVASQSRLTDVDANHKVLELTSKQIRTLDELLLVCGVDLDEWDVERHSVNKWDIGAKSDDGSIVTTPLFQIKASLVKKSFLLQPASVQPIQINIGKFQTLASVKKAIKRAVIIPDIQVGFRKDLNTGQLVPFHDRRAVNLAMQLVQYINPDRIVYLGDNLDLPEYSDKFIVSPEFLFTTQPSLVELAWIYGTSRALAPNAQIDAIEGNHECFDDRTEILTNHGWKLFEDVTESDKVAGFDTTEQSIKYDYPVDIHKYRFQGHLQTINSEFQDLAVTDNHRMLYYAVGDYGEFEKELRIEEFSRFAAEEKVRAPFAAINTKPDAEMTDDEIVLGAWLLKFTYKNKQLFSRPTFSASQKVKDTLHKLGVQFTSVSNLKRSAASVSILNLKRITERTVYIRIAKESIEYCKRYLSLDGGLPEWVHKLSARQFEIFLNTFNEKEFSSARQTNSSHKRAQGPKNFIDGLQTVCISNGYRAVITEPKRRLPSLTISKTRVATINLKKSLGLLKYDGFVYCATTKQDTVVVRRNGKVSITGNSRLERAVMKNLKQVHNLRPVNKLNDEPTLSVASLLNLESLQIKYHGPYPQGEVWLNDNFVIHHGDVVRSASGKTVSKVVEDARANEAFGHIHRLEMAAKTVWAYNGPKTYQAWSFGTLASIKPGVVPAFKAKNNWQQGIGVVDYEEGNGFINITPIFFYNGVAVYNQQKFTADKEENIIKQLIKDTGYKF